jgi:LytS/YehU family sensor histidine kinase
MGRSRIRPNAGNRISGALLGIQQRRFRDRLRFHLEIAEDVLTCSVPSLVLQPLVESAARHGIAKHKENDKITVRAFRNADHLHLEVQNVTGRLTGSLDKLVGAWDRISE